jgi:hypothetical protein
MTASSARFTFTPAGQRRPMAGLSSHLRRGLAAGAIGGTAMSVSTNLEMRLRGREPSRVPVQTIERFLPLDLSRRQEERLVTVGHVVSSACFGLLRGLLEAAGAPAALANAVFAASAFSPDFVVIPATGGAPPPWRWRPVELVTSAVHHGVYGSITVAVYEWLGRRGG